MAEAVTLAPVDARLEAAVLALRPQSGQERFSGLPADTLPAARSRPGREPVAILRDGSPAGFFVLDDDPLFARHAGDGPALGLRAFFVDAAHQGRGVARAALAALPAYVADRHASVCRVALTVNVANPVAVHAYRRAGFRDTGRLDHSGGEGPQHVLVLDLKRG